MRHTLWSCLIRFCIVLRTERAWFCPQMDGQTNTDGRTGGEVKPVYPPFNLDRWSSGYNNYSASLHLYYQFSFHQNISHKFIKNPYDNLRLIFKQCECKCLLLCDNCFFCLFSSVFICFLNKMLTIQISIPVTWSHYDSEKQYGVDNLGPMLVQVIACCLMAPSH